MKKLLALAMALLMTVGCAVCAFAESPVYAVSKVTGNGTTLTGTYDKQTRVLSYSGSCKNGYEPNFPVELAMLLGSKNKTNQAIAILTGSEWLTAGSLSDAAGSGRLKRIQYKLKDDKSQSYSYEANYTAKNGRVASSDASRKWGKDKSGDFFNAFTYDSKGSLTSYEADGSISMTYLVTYANGVPSAISGNDTATNASESYTLKTSNGRITSADYKSGYTTYTMSFTYDSNGRITAVRSTDARGNKAAVVTNVKYNSNGTVASMNLYGKTYTFSYMKI